jgi:heme/copper-type cytochrome/quinol oxidase subunit 3
LVKEVVKMIWWIFILSVYILFVAVILAFFQGAYQGDKEE